MNITYLAESTKDTLVVFFGGFASLPHHFAHLHATTSVVMCYGYQRLDSMQELRTILNTYKNRILIAFSMGVCVAAKLLDSVCFDKAIAINGTSAGIDDTFGISNKLFMRTVQSLDVAMFGRMLFGTNSLESNKPKYLHSNLDFRESTALDSASSHFCELFAPREILLEELASLQYFCSCDQNLDFLYTSALIAREDKIFPPSACERFFIQKPNVKIHYLNAPHFVFYHFNTWEELCAL